MIEGATDLEPAALLEACLGAEAALGRVRRERWGPRTIDVDILTYGDEVVEAQDLQIPHPRAHRRGFVLAPLLELDPDPRLADGRRLAALRLGPGAVEGIRVHSPPLLEPS